MGRAIDADKLLEQLQKKKCGPANKRYTEGFNDCLMRVRSMIHSAPTLTPPNEPLTLEEMRGMDGPVWVACKPIEGGDGYWCLCRHGKIITPSGNIFDAGKIPHWVFYRRPPEVSP